MQAETKIAPIWERFASVERPLAATAFPLRGAQHRQLEHTRSRLVGDDLGREVHAAAAAGAGAGAHGQLVQVAAAFVGRAANLAFGDPMADADVHAGALDRDENDSYLKA